MFGEDYDDPFQGMEPIFGLESSGTEDVSPENNEAEEIEKAQGIPREDYEKKQSCHGGGMDLSLASGKDTTTLN